MERWLALELANTIRNDGSGGLADHLATVEQTARWLAEQDGLPAPDEAEVDESFRCELVELRAAVRALFARAVSPRPASRADAGRLMPVRQALARLNEAAAREPVVPCLDWPEGAAPSVRLLSAEADPRIRVLGALARDAVEFLSGPCAAHLRSCTAPRCVRYFVKSHGRQEWCKPSCGNRARAARHYRRRQAPA
ncbi:ABATE domain-containing protein [Streptomyces sp. CC210A]|uniref:CGNR zinc finger domain-containing protein n=1 Tax=Streptomyces sp. CC210A TaxID=2898184 RepID=UPI001F1C077F|nr:ABATE domain-containing protein [Streptomyces sp. CC210A]